MQSRDALLTVSVVVDEVEAVLVEGCAHRRLGDGKTDSVGESLTERTSSDLNTVSVACLGVPRRQRTDLTELLEVVHGELVAHEVEEDVLECATIKV